MKLKKMKGITSVHRYHRQKASHLYVWADAAVDPSCSWMQNYTGYICEVSSWNAATYDPAGQDKF